jgi:hypothetical protein
MATTNADVRIEYRLPHRDGIAQSPTRHTGLKEPSRATVRCRLADRAAAF